MKSQFPIVENLIPLVRSYNVLLPIIELRKLVQTTFPNCNAEELNKYALHKIINDGIINNYNGEVKIKALLVDYFIKDNAVSCFEIRANSSRLDYLRINGESISYEIKSELDTLVKLEKQVNDYSELFEYNYIVSHIRHIEKAKEIIPCNYGIINITDNEISIERKAKKNRQIDSNKQLNLLTKNLHSLIHQKY